MFRSHLAQCLDEIGFKITVANPNVWMKTNTKPNGESYCEYMLVYVDDLMCISHVPEETLSELKDFIKLKKNKIEEPTIYLGATVEKKRINELMCWTISSRDYIRNVIINVEEIFLKQQQLNTFSMAQTPMSNGYVPELDDIIELDKEGITVYQELIGI